MFQKRCRLNELYGEPALPCGHFLNNEDVRKPSGNTWESYRSLYLMKKI
ncbi:hypothetical protein [Methanoplanus limicola]|nr:hypothetical protein [Methanoplanus limicola]